MGESGLRLMNMSHSRIPPPGLGLEPELLSPRFPDLSLTPGVNPLHGRSAGGAQNSVSLSPHIPLRGRAPLGPRRAKPPPSPADGNFGVDHSGMGLPHLADQHGYMHAQRQMHHRMKAAQSFRRSSEEEEPPRMFNPDPLPFKSSVFNMPLPGITQWEDSAWLENSTSPRSRLLPIPGHRDPGHRDPPHPEGLSYALPLSLHDPLANVKVEGVGCPAPETGGTSQAMLLYERRKRDPKPRSHFTREQTLLELSQVEKYRSSTMFRKVSKKGESLHTSDSALKPRPYLHHTDRYQWDDLYSNESSPSPSQRERMAAEMDLMEQARGIKKYGNIMAHRECMDFLMGGQKVELEERDSIMAEVSKLKGVMLPTRAKDLYVGRGFRLPENHALNKPRARAKPTPAPVAMVTQSAPSVIQRPKLRMPRRVRATNMRPIRPALTAKPPSLGAGPIKSLKVAYPASAPAENNAAAQNKIYREAAPMDTSDVLDPTNCPRPESEMNIPLPEDLVKSPTPAEPRLPDPQPDPTGTPLNQDPASPLKGSNLPSLIDLLTLEQLRATFTRLDTDADGHITYPQYQTQLPPDLTAAEGRYIKQVYEMTSEVTFFGVEEFQALSILCSRLTALIGPAREALQCSNRASSKDNIQQYMELYAAGDTQLSGSIPWLSVRDLLSSLHQTITDAQFGQLTANLNPAGAERLSKVDFLLYIPYFLQL